MRAGEIWTASAGDRGYAGKPRPVVIVQENLIDEFDSVVLCLLTSSDEKNEHRVLVDPCAANGLEVPSWVMTDKLLAIRKSALGRKIGSVSEAELAAIRKELAYILGIG